MSVLSRNMKSLDPGDLCAKYLGHLGVNCKLANVKFTMYVEYQNDWCKLVNTFVFYGVPQDPHIEFSRAESVRCDAFIKFRLAKG